MYSSACMHACMHACKAPFFLLFSTERMARKLRRGRITEEAYDKLIKSKSNRCLLCIHARSVSSACTQVCMHACMHAFRGARVISVGV